MSGGFAKLFSILQIARIGLVWTAISNAWLVILWSRRLEAGDMALWTDSLWVPLLCGAVAATGLYVFGMTMNDIMDEGHDRRFAPGRPLPSGKLTRLSASIIAGSALMLAIAFAVPLGVASVGVCVGVAVLIVFYDGLGKHLPAAGLLSLGVIRGLHMMAYNPKLIFCWPVWTTMTFIVALSVICYWLEEKRPRLSPRHLWVVTAGWAFITLGLIWLMQRRDGLVSELAPWVWAGPGVAIGGFILLALRLVSHTGARREAGGKLMKLGLQWLIVLDASWLAGAGLWLEAILILSLLGAARATMWLVVKIKMLAGKTEFLGQVPKPSGRRGV